MTLQSASTAVLFRCTVLSSPFFVSFSSIVLSIEMNLFPSASVLLAQPHSRVDRYDELVQVLGKRLEMILQRRGYSCSRLRNLALPVGSFLRRTSLAGLTDTFSFSMPSR